MTSNPILKGFNPDPSIIRVGSDYYVATSTFEWYPGVQIHHSKDLVNWRLISRPLNRQKLLDMRGNPDSCGVWAPCLSYSNGLFYLIYTDTKRLQGSFKDSQNYLTCCASIDGDWSDPIYLNSSGFDPSLFHHDGRKWLLNMLWDHRPGHNPFAGIVLQEYSAEAQTLIGPVHNIFTGTEMGCTEAPHLYWHNNYFYLLTAEGGTGYDHCITLARSKNIEGPYEVDPEGYLLTSKDAPALPLQRSGHGDLVDTTDGELFMVHLCSRPLPGLRRSPLGRETSLQKVSWNNEGWLRLEQGGNQPSINLPDISLPRHPWPVLPERDQFDTSELASHFNWLRTPDLDSFCSLQDRPGYLRLKGKQSIGNLFEQALIARRQQSVCCTATTLIEFNPDNFQQMAGLVCYYNASKFHYLYVSKDQDNGRHLGIISCSGDSNALSSFPLYEKDPNNPVIPVPEDAPIYLRAVIRYAELVFLWSLDESNWQDIPLRLDYSLLSDESGSGDAFNFTGTFLGVCCQDLSGSDRSADFSYFELVDTSEANDH